MKLLFYGDSPAVATGFGRVNKQILNGLVKKDRSLDITVIGINDRGAYKNPDDYPYKIYPAIYDNYHDIFGLSRLIGALSKQDPEIPPTDYDVLFINYDCFFLWEALVNEKPLINTLVEVSGRVKKKILYTPIDNHVLKGQWVESMKFFDNILIPSEYGRRVVKKYDERIFKKLEVVPYSVDSNVFKPLAKHDKDRVRKEFGDAIGADLSNKFIIGFVGRNQWRKDIPRLIRIFYEFKKQHQEAYLYLHTNPFDRSGDGGNLLEFLEFFGMEVKKDFIFPFNLNQNKGIPQSNLNELYNIMDVYLSCSTGEGFGLPYLEAMSAGVPVIAPDNTTVPELLKNHGFIYKNITTHSFGYIDWMRERELGDINEALAKLKEVYDLKTTSDSNSLNTLLFAGRQFAESFTQERMVNKIYGIIGSV